MKRILVGSDKSGYTLKEFVKNELISTGRYEIEDCGTIDIENPISFFDVAPKAAKKIQEGEFNRAILFCGTGMGMAIVCNKFKGVYASVVESVYAAEKCRAINDANVLSMGAWIVGDMMALSIAKKFLETEFTEGLEEWRKAFLIKAKEEIKQLESGI